MAAYSRNSRQSEGMSTAECALFTVAAAAASAAACSRNNVFTLLMICLVAATTTTIPAARAQSAGGYRGVSSGGSVGRDYPPYPHYPPSSDGYRGYERHHSGIAGHEERLREDGDSRCNVIHTDGLPLTRTVVTPYGTYEGKIVYLCDSPSTKRDDRPVTQGGSNYPRRDYVSSAVAFLGVAYAEPPLGIYRFRDPQPATFRGSVEAKRFAPACLQHSNYTGAMMGVEHVSEDCLYLNIYIPNETVNRGQKFAVMIYIHDGEFKYGSGNSFPGHMLAATQEVAVVTFNYRLGALGFLATGDNSSAGNFGLMDQRAAINWVYTNIEHFNGDRDRITIFGPGAGAAAAGIHFMQQIFGEDLHIRRVIAMSGSAVADWAAIDDIIFVRNVSRLFGEQVGCWATDSWKLVECLKRKSNNSVEFTMTSVKSPRGWLAWGPVLDRNTRFRSPGMPHTPWEYLENQAPRKERLRPLAYMTGVTVNDASFIPANDEDLQSIGFNMRRSDFESKIRTYAKTYNYTVNEEAIVDAIRFMYTPWMAPDNSSLLMEEYVNMFTDSLYVAPMDRMVKLLLEINIPVYQYVLNFSLTSEYFLRKQREWDRVPHNLESLLVSGAPFMDPKFYPPSFEFNRIEWSDGDRNMSSLLMEAWANFAKEGNPTPNALFGVVDWKPMAIGNLQYLSINATHYEAHNASSFMFRDYRQKQAQFWNSYVPGIFGRPEHSWPYWDELPLEYENRVYRTSLYFVSALAGLFLFLALLGFCCYCRASRYNGAYDYPCHEDKFDGGSSSPMVSGANSSPNTSEQRVSAATAAGGGSVIGAGGSMGALRRGWHSSSSSGHYPSAHRGPPSVRNAPTSTTTASPNRHVRFASG